MLHDNRKTVTLINGTSFKLPPWCIIEDTNTTRLHMQGGDRLFANWYIISIK